MLEPLTPSAEAVEAAARGAYQHNARSNGLALRWEELPNDWQDRMREATQATLLAAYPRLVADVLNQAAGWLLEREAQPSDRVYAAWLQHKAREVVSGA